MSLGFSFLLFLSFCLCIDFWKEQKTHSTTKQEVHVELDQKKIGWSGGMEIDQIPAREKKIKKEGK